MARYFYNFPKIEYTFKDGTTQKLVDLNVKYNLTNAVKNASEVFYKYTWREGDRPDIVADWYYKGDEMYWLVLLANDVYDVFHDIPMTSNAFTKYLINKYRNDAIEYGVNDEDILAYCQQTIHHYEDDDGYWIDLETFTLKGYTNFKTIYQQEFIENEEKRNVRLIDDTKALTVKSELESKFKELKVR
jgi:hypothetical protein